MSLNAELDIFIIVIIILICYARMFAINGLA